MTRAAIQQRQRLFREGLVLLLAEVPEVEVVATAVTGDELHDRCVDCRPDVAVLEIDAEEWDPCRLAQRIQRRLPGIRFVGTCRSLDDSASVDRARRAGLRQLVARVDGFAALLTALQDDAAGPAPDVRTLPLDAGHRDALTPREVGVLELIGAGWTSREISDRLSITHKTVENHKQRIFGKLGVQNQAHAVAVAMRRGLIRPDGVIDLTEGA